ncbi:MAG: formylglycine-generating enzyme family protein [Rhodoferax sp.]|uniref:formylglycine-generating enzyme family protein n=1 Tax=Rhodoferax sp. TaxID=50421 RepID=UPI002631E422|nr:formylglycine-generating enzyme family protein [Rhodoferax sp.]MDD2882850.1 formylglycine-generating enzyme family protein [Rhodoferax sp.]
MNLNEYLSTLDANKPAAQPLPPHQAQALDDHTRSTYALMLASVLHTRPPVTEAQARVFDLLLGSLGLPAIQAKLFAQAQTLEESTLLEAKRLFVEHRLSQVFMLDLLLLERLRGPLDEDSLKLVSELADFLALNETQMHALSSLTSHIMGLNPIPADWDSAISDVTAPQWLEFTIVIPMVDIPAGKFEMGGTDSDNSPKHLVTVSAFQMGATPVTLGMFKKFIAAAWRQDLLTKEFNEANKYGDNVPVTYVSWHDAQDFIAWLNKISGGGYRLPSEAEWEYAGTSGGIHKTYCGGDNYDTVSWFAANSGGKPHPVGQKAANAFGLYDMSGNVWEWVQDPWHDNYKDAPINGNAWTDEISSKPVARVLRGGSWNYSFRSARAAFRSSDSPVDRYDVYGFRLARTC